MVNLDRTFWSSLPGRFTQSALKGVIFFFCLGTLVVYGVSMLHQLITPDFPWILQSGRYILDHHQLPHHDIFSWTYPNRGWILYQWLFEIIVAFGAQLLGDQSFFKLAIVFIMAIYVLCPLWITNQKVPPLLTLLISVLALHTATMNLSLRPMVATSCFLLGQYCLLKGLRENRISMRRALPVLAVLYVLWGNMHTLVVLGLIMLGLMALGDWLESKGYYAQEQGQQTEPIQGLPFKTYVVLLGVAFLASGLNPYGWGIYAYLFHLTSQSYLKDNIVELMSPNFHLRSYLPFLLLMSWFLISLAEAKRIYRARNLLTLLAFTLVTLLSQRMVVWTCLLYSLMLPDVMMKWWQTIRLADDQDSLPATGLYRKEVLCSLILVGSLAFWLMPTAGTRVTTGICESYRGGIQAYQSIRQGKDRLFQDEIIGGCMRLFSPKQPVYFDSRFDFYPIAFSKAIRDTTSLKPGWQNLLDQWRLNTFLVERKLPLAQMLQANPSYQIMYQDSQMLIAREKAR